MEWIEEAEELVEARKELHLKHLTLAKAIPCACLSEGEVYLDLFSSLSHQLFASSSFEGIDNVKEKLGYNKNEIKDNKDILENTVNENEEDYKDVLTRVANVYQRDVIVYSLQNEESSDCYLTEETICPQGFTGSTNPISPPLRLFRSINGQFDAVVPVLPHEIDSLFKVDESISKRLDKEFNGLMSLFEEQLKPEIDGPVFHLLRLRVNDWMNRLNQLRKYLDELSKDVVIGIVGDAGRGKSTLINALLGQEILPTSASEICTAIPMKICYADIDQFTATLQLISFEELLQDVDTFVTSRKQIEQLYKSRDKLVMGKKDPKEGEEKDSLDYQQVKEQCNRLEEQFKPLQDRIHAFFGRSESSCLGYLRKKMVTKPIKTKKSSTSKKEKKNHMFDYTMLEKVTARLELAKQMLSSTLIKIEKETCTELQKELQNFVQASSKKKTQPTKGKKIPKRREKSEVYKEEQLQDSIEKVWWPLIKDTHIQGRFDLIRNGISLVDLPGINDANTACAAATNNILSSCSFVIQTVDPRNQHTISQTKLFTSLFMKGLTRRMVIVPTKLDAENLDNVRKQMNFDEEDDDEKVLVAYMCKIAYLYANWLRTSIATEIVSNAKGTKVITNEVEKATKQIENALAKDVQVIRIVPVCATEHLKLEKVVHYKNKPILRNTEDTGIPILRRLVHSLGVGRFIQLSLLEELLTNFKHYIKQQLSGVETNPENREIQSKLIRVLKEQMKTELDRVIQVMKSNLENEISSLGLKIKGEEQNIIKNSIILLFNERNSTHWNTFKAAMRRSGVFHCDYNKIFTDIYLTHLQVDINNIFQNQVPLYMNQCIRGDMMKVLNRFKESVAMHDFGAQYSFQLQQAEKIMQQLSNSIDILIQTINQTLDVDLLKFTRQVLEKYYTKAANECGSGTFDRMIRDMEEGVKVLHPGHTREVLSKVIYLCKEITRRVEEHIPTLIAQFTGSLEQISVPVTLRKLLIERIDSL